MGLFGDPSSLLPSGAVSNDVKVAVRGIDPSATTPTDGTQVATATSQPITGQPNNTPLAQPDNGAFSIDYYRNGNAGGEDSETTNPMTLTSEDDDQIASMTLSVSAADTVSSLQSSNTLAGTEIISQYARFFLQSVTEAEQEKYQVVETFTGFYAFFYGKRPPIYRYSGLLLSDQNYRWNNDFKFIYENYFRGTKAAEFGAEVVLYYDSRIITGFPLSLSMQQEALNDKGMPFSMDILVIDHTPVNFSLDIASLIQQKQQELTQVQNQILAAQALLQQSGPSVQISDLVNNGSLPASSVSLPNISPTSLGPISQLSA